MKREAKSNQRNELVRDLKQRIKNGDSTGDKVRDYLIVGGDFDGVYERKCRALEEKLVGQEGNSVLVIGERERNIMRDTSTRIMVPEYNFKIGVLNSGLDFDLNNLDLVISCEKHVMSFQGDKWEICDGPILLKLDEFYSSGNSFEIYVGDEVERCVDGAGILFPKRNLYVEALDLLGDGDKVSDKFRKSYNNNFLKRRKEILNRLELHNPELDLSKKICGDLKVSVSDYVVNMCKEYDVEVSSLK